MPRVDKELRTNVERVLNASGVVVPVKDAKPVFRVVTNNIADLDEARAKGFKTGLTFGGAGSMVDDNYEFSCVFTSAEGAKRDVGFKHSIHSAIGHTKERPAGLTPTSPVLAFVQVVEDSVLNCLMGLQAAGVL